MTSLLAILHHVPAWVFAVFALLACVGSRQLAAHAMPLPRVVLVSVAMAALSLYGTVAAFGDRPLALLGWATAAALAGTAVLRRPLPPGIRYDPDGRRFQLPGSAVPLALMMGIFLTKFVVGASLALHPALAHDSVFALAVGTLYGAFAGTFAARALRLCRLALRHEATAGAAPI